MLPQTDAFHQSSNQILMAMKELQIGRLLRQANIRKACGIPVLELFHVLVLLVFHVLASGENNHFGSGDFDQFLVKQK